MDNITYTDYAYVRCPKCLKAVGCFAADWVHVFKAPMEPTPGKLTLDLDEVSLHKMNVDTEQGRADLFQFTNDAVIKHGAECQIQNGSPS